MDEVDGCQAGEGVAGCWGSERVLQQGPLGAGAQQFCIGLLPPAQVLRAGVCWCGGEPPLHPKLTLGTPNPGDRDRIQPLPEKPESFSVSLAQGGCAPHPSPVFFRGTLGQGGSVATPGPSCVGGLGGPTHEEGGQVTAVARWQVQVAGLRGQRGV